MDTVGTVTAHPDLSDIGSDIPVVRRIWAIAPEPRRDGSIEPLLTGIFGFPWRTAALDAKCTIVERDHGSVGGRTRLVDRHHRVVPDPDCTCGIYATVDVDGHPAALVARTRPVATGFVALMGRILRTGNTLRAQRAAVVGPLAVDLGRPPLAAVPLMGTSRPPHPLRVTIEAGSFKVLWGWGADRTGEWLDETAAALADRYGLEVTRL